MEGKERNENWHGVTNECVWDWSLGPWIIPEVQNEPRADCMSCTNSKKEVCEIQNKWLKFKSSCWSGEIQTERVHWDEFLPLGYCSLPFLGSSASAKQSLNAMLGVTVLNILYQYIWFDIKRKIIHLVSCTELLPALKLQLCLLCPLDTSAQITEMLSLFTNKLILN